MRRDREQAAFDERLADCAMAHDGRTDRFCARARPSSTLAQPLSASQRSQQSQHNNKTDDLHHITCVLLYGNKHCNTSTAIGPVAYMYLVHISAAHAIASHYYIPQHTST
jgi:hypothetical protein